MDYYEQIFDRGLKPKRYVETETPIPETPAYDYAWRAPGLGFWKKLQLFLQWKYA